MSVHNMVKVVVLNMLIANFPKYFNNCTDCAFHKFALIALLAHFMTFRSKFGSSQSQKTCDYFD